LLEGIEINYTANVGSSYGIMIIPINGVDQEGDISFVKYLNNYDITGSSLVFVYVFCNNSILIFLRLLLCSSLITFLVLISVP